MKILMVNKFLYPRGGSESYMLKLGDQLRALGHEVQYFGMYDEKNTVGNEAGLTTSNMDFHSTGAARFLYPFKIIYSREAEKKIGKVLDQFKPDVVHMNNINFQLTPSIFYAIKKRNIPLVQTVHDYQMICPNHLLYSFKETKPCERCIHGSKWNCFKYSCIHDSKVKSLLGSLEAKLYNFLKTYKKVDLYVCPSYFLESKLLSASNLYKGKTFTIHNFIEKKNVPSKLQDSEPYIVFAGRLSKEKGIELLAETAKKLPQYKFVVAGNGPDGDCLKGISNVKLTGFLTGTELVNVMANAKLMIVPSVWYENCPLTILEAHSMGVPVVAMNSGGMAELIEDGKTGGLAMASTVEAVVEAIEKCLDDNTYKVLKENCTIRSQEIIEVQGYCNILLEKYRGLIK